MASSGVIDRYWDPSARTRVQTEERDWFRSLCVPIFPFVIVASNHELWVSGEYIEFGLPGGIGNRLLFIETNGTVDDVSILFFLILC